VQVGAQNLNNSSSFTLSVIADCQYANQPNKGERLYTQCPNKLAQAVTAINKQSPTAVIHLGDFIDTDFNSFDRLLKITNKLTPSFYHVLGNHEFSVADKFKTRITHTLNMPARYYTLDRFNCRFIA